MEGMAGRILQKIFVFFIVRALHLTWEIPRVHEYVMGNPETPKTYLPESSSYHICVYLDCSPPIPRGSHSG